jgi:Putative prokaryotic signal transducing protein
MTSDELVTVFVPSDPGEQALIESILDEAEIHYAAENSQTQNLFGTGQIGSYSFAVGPVRIRVVEEDAERARQLIEEAVGSSIPPAELAEGSAAEGPLESSHDPAYRYATCSMAWAVFSLGGVGSALAILFGIRALRLMHPSSRRSRHRAIFGLVLGIGGVVSRLLYLYWSILYPGSQ